MLKPTLPAPSPALVVSSIALFVALGGTTYAATRLPMNSVGTIQLKDNAVTARKIKNRSVTAEKINTKFLHVPDAARAVYASHATTATMARSAETAATATHAASATNAVNATNAGHATVADSATLANALPVLTWSSLALLNGWAPSTAGPFGVKGLQYTKDAEGFVHLRGILNGKSATGNIAASLPMAYRPPNGAWVPLGETNGTSTPHPENAYIDPSGNIKVLAGSGSNNSFVSFEGVEFYVG